MAQRICVLGSTGSVGVQSLEVAEKRGIEIIALTADRNVSLMEKQIRKYKPQLVAMADEKAAAELKVLVADTDTRVLSGKEGVCFCAESEGADTVVSSIVGIAGLEPTLAAIEQGKNIALANKETLVAAGALVTEKVKEKGVSLLPVDSEHSAIFQCLQGMNKKQELKSIILTASGGPFFSKTRKELKDITLAQALRHPNWSMGAKITVDSATLMNKGLELIEAMWLFDVPAEKLDVVIHRESIVHSLIEYTDNSVIAQLGEPDMRIPIQYALTYPARFPSPVKKLNLWEHPTLTFRKPDYESFPLPLLCLRAAEKGGLYPAVVNAANEKANELFRQEKIGFLDIERCVEYALENIRVKKDYTLSDVIETDSFVRSAVENFILK